MKGFYSAVCLWYVPLLVRADGIIGDTLHSAQTNNFPNCIHGPLLLQATSHWPILLLFWKKQSASGFNLSNGFPFLPDNWRFTKWTGNTPIDWLLDGWIVLRKARPFAWLFSAFSQSRLSFIEHNLSQVSGFLGRINQKLLKSCFNIKVHVGLRSRQIRQTGQ